MNGTTTKSHIVVSMNYTPVKMLLNPTESINNMGFLRVDVLSGGFSPHPNSNPYCKFTLNGQMVHKTSVQKKTASPVWNENFEVKIRSRTAANFRVYFYK